ncbi:Inactive ATP-dependent zinc metalloprotease FTSHI 2 like [Actinidia chinensis var. chinensis]|uniref:Inactive ATP-dependent zinc metalloprotease FTSHI 2 like n=1 Tax=Actinidia chinensis var. chinensis TaxID=1590841 RepID=A0A2R6QZY3_ACTCC|nr:Inactive ATP-dependent zinc metalloprotease FTSHI 2 like [Actinidia chinensis var. chinensis]
MACHCALGTSFVSSLPLRNRSVSRRTVKKSLRFCRAITCELESSEAEEELKSKPKRNRLDVLKLSVTLTVISASLPQPSIAAKVSEKKRSAKKTDALSPEELKSWSQGLPVVTQRIPYSEIFNLRREGKLKHIIKHPSTGLKQRPEVVLAVMEDSSVLRLVLPSIQIDKKFWESWDELGMDSICMNAYTPPLQKSEIPASYFEFLLKFLSKIPDWLRSAMKPKPNQKPKAKAKAKAKPVSKTALEAKRMREELRLREEEELETMRLEREITEKVIREQKRAEERERKIAMKKMKYEESLEDTSDDYMWVRLAADKNVANIVGLVFFVLFYQTVVVSYKKQKKDYDDRLKIQIAEAEEQRKMRELEMEMEGIEGGEDLEEEGRVGQNAYMKMAKQFMKSGARVRWAHHKRPPQFLDRDVDVTFSDVAGLGKIRLELEEIVKFFTHGEMYRRRGVKIPGGILLCGPPGVGKTLLAKAVAGEAGVNFFSISASQFVEIYVGVGASRVRALYQEAKEMAPSVVFIDELDAVGRERGLIKGSGGQERDATLNQLLVCLDGFEGRGEVITIASTNRPDILDPALVRPGRFDRKIYIPKPGLIGREEILKVHARKKPMAKDVDYVAVASVTNGMAGADLANIIEVAAINMMRDGRTEISTDDLFQAAQIEESGLLDLKYRSLEMWKRVAFNEAAMAVVAVNFPDFRNIEFVNIAPRAGRNLGYVRVNIDHVKYSEGMLSRQSVLDHITVQLAPRAADEIWNGEDQLSTMWVETAHNARLAARVFVLGGLSEKHYGLSKFWVEDRINGIDEEALRILHTCYDRAKEILLKNRELMEAMVKELVEKKSLTKLEFFRLVELHGSLEPMPPSIFDIWLAKRLQFQNMITEQKEAGVPSNV